MSDLSDWYYQIPTFTRWWLTATVGFSLAGRFGFVNPYLMILNTEQLLYNFEIWRPVTAVLFHPISPTTGFHFLINIYFLYNYSKRLETMEYDGRPADYLYMLLVNWIGCVIFGSLINMSLLMDSMVLSVLYVWCQLNKDVIVTFWFGTRFKAMYLPWVLFGFNFVMSGEGISELIGIIVGHLYYFLKFAQPQEYGGESWLNTPSFLYDYFPSRPSTSFGQPPPRSSRLPTSFGQPPPRSAAAAPSSTTSPRHFWGQGRVLGRGDHMD